MEKIIMSEGFAVPSENVLREFCDLCHNEPRKIVDYLQFFSIQGFNIDFLRKFFNKASDEVMDELLVLFLNSHGVLDMVNWFNSIENQDMLKVLNNLKGYLLTCLTERTANKRISKLSSKALLTLNELGEKNLLRLMEMLADLPKSAYVSEDSAKFSLITMKMKLLNSSNTISNTNNSEASLAHIQSLHQAKNKQDTPDNPNTSSLILLNPVDSLNLSSETFSEDTDVFNEEEN